MQIIISLLVIGLLWMIYDIINAPAVDEDEIQISTETEETPPLKGVIKPAQKKTESHHKDSEVDELK